MLFDMHMQFNCLELVQVSLVVVGANGWLS